MRSATIVAEEDTYRLHARAQARGKAMAKAGKRQQANGEKANSDPRAAERGPRTKDTKVEKGAREKEKDTKGRVGVVDKLVTSRPSARTTCPCKGQKDNETEEISGQSNWQATSLALWCVAPCGKWAAWKW